MSTVFAEKASKNISADEKNAHGPLFIMTLVNLCIAPVASPEGGPPPRPLF